jgi:hypothetical protein
MIKNKITNISSVKLEFFIKVDNSDDVLVSIEPGDVVFSDGEEPTRSMRVFERKNLISILTDDFDSVSVDKEDKAITAIWHSDTTKHLKDFHGVDAHVDMEQVLKNEINHNIVASVTENEDPYKDLLAIDLTFEGESNLDEAKKQAENYVEESEGEVVKEKKKYNYKKKPGRKKKRGPKPGSKKKKGE